MDITIDIKRLLKNFDKIEKQMPNITKGTINDIGFDAMGSLRGGLPQWLHLTKPKFMKSQIFVQKATTSNLVTLVGFSTKLHLMDTQIKTSPGRIRLPFRGKTIAIPIAVPRSGKGGITKANRPDALLAKKNYFRGTVGGRDGIWRRNIGSSKAVKAAKGRVSLMYLLVPRTTYPGQGNVPLNRVVQQVIKRRFVFYVERNMKRAMDRAIQRDSRR